MPSQSCRDVHTTAPNDEFNPHGFLGFITYIRCPEHIHASCAALASPWHIDRDEVGYRENGRYSLPLLSTVFYPHVSCAGGELLVADNPPMQEGQTGPPPRFRSVISIPPAVNRLVVFSPGILHRINQLEGERYSIAVNIWQSESLTKQDSAPLA